MNASHRQLAKKEDATAVHVMSIWNDINKDTEQQTHEYLTQIQRVIPTAIMALKLFVLFLVVALANGHGYIKDPIARTAIHLRPEFNAQQPLKWNYSAMECNGVPQDSQFSTCGRCGEAPGTNDNSQGGMYDKGIIVATYQAGAVVQITAEFLAGHYGYFDFELCPQTTETNNCFQKLPVVSASEEVRNGNRVCVPYNNGDSRIITAQVWLPAGVRCERCTIRWNYRTSYPGRPDWDICDNQHVTQIFRNCADVKIV